MHLLLSVTMVAAAGVGVVTAVAGRRPHPLALAQAAIATGAMLLHAVGLLGAGGTFGTIGLFAVAALLLVSSLVGLASARRSSVALSRAVMGIAMAFLLVATSSYASPDVLGSPDASAAVAAVTHHSATAMGAAGAGAGSASTAALLGAVALAAATWAGVRMLRSRRYTSGVECLSMGVCLAGMGAMALV